MSPLRQNYAPSPLNEKPGSSGLSRTTSNDQVPRPASVTIPSLGEEGIEYEDLNAEKPAEDPETRNVGSELKLHAPKPSLPTSSATAKVQAVTRTDSRQAAAAGIGAETPGSEEQHERSGRPLHTRTISSREESSTASADRYSEEHGIPEIGQRVPMYPNAGDVQAPSPAPHHLEHGQRPGRSQHRVRNNREASLPPGSYGLHGHGVHNNDKFEKAWYQKHPNEYAKEEQSQHAPGGTPKPDWALSSDDLNKIVRGSAVTGSGLGTSPAVTGTPEEEVGYMASDEYTQRMASPAPDRSARPVIESPLRKMSHPTAEKESKQEITHDSGVIHVDEPYHHSHHPDGFAPTPAPEEQAKPGDLKHEEEEPILAADEVRPESAFQHPAISPTLERGDSFDEFRSRTPSTGHSRSNSRSTSNHGRPALARWTSRGSEREDPHTPLEDVAEYEPLFPEDKNKEKKPVSTAERFKHRPELKHRFPSQDIWEDSPNSLQLHTTVTTPDTQKLESFETPEQESIRRSQTASVDPHEVATHILESEEHKGNDTKRPSLSKQRFPSKDVWEDAPDSQQLVTTVKAPEDVPHEVAQEAPKESPKEELTSPDVPKKPSIPVRPARRPQLTPPAVDPSTKPGTSPTEKRQPPSIPGRPKPQIPIRPAKKSPEEPKKEEPKDAAAKPKPPVPARPGGSKIAALKAGFLTDLNSRLQGGPPKPPEKKKEEEPAEKKPLQDARKGRARGPARRKPAPAVSPSTTTTTATKTAGSRPPAAPEVKIADVWNIWQIDEDGQLVVSGQDVSKRPGPELSPEPLQPVTTQSEKPKPKSPKLEPSEPEPEPSKPELSQPEIPPMAPELSKNVAGEPTDPAPSPKLVETPEAELKKPETVVEPVVKQEENELSPIESVVPGPSAESEIPITAKSPTTSPITDHPNAEIPAFEPNIIEPQETNKPSHASPELKLEKTVESMAASADGKRESDGDIQIDQ